MEYRSAETLSPTVGYYLALLALGLATAVLGPTLPALARQTQSDLGEIGFVFLTCSLGYMLGSLQAGRWYDRRPGHGVLAAALLVLAVTLALIPVMRRLWLLTVVLLVVGVAQGAVDVGGNTLLAWVHRDRVGPWLNGLHFCFGAGTLLAPLIVALTASSDGSITWAYWVLATLALPGAIWLIRLPSPTASAATAAGPGREGHRFSVLLIAVFVGLYVGAEIGFGSWVFSYAVQLNLVGETAAAYLTSAFWGALTLGRLLAVPLAARLRPQVILLCDLAGCLVSVGLLLGWSSSVTVLWLGTVGIGLSMASIFPSTLSLAGRRLTITGRATAWFIGGGAAGSMVLPWLIGLLFTSVGPRAVVFLLMVDLCAALAVLTCLLAAVADQRWLRAFVLGKSSQVTSPAVSE